MKFKLAGISLMFFWVCAVSAQVSAPKEGQRLRIMSYNIHNGTGLDGQRDLERIAAVIHREDPDVVAIQEADSMTERSGSVDMMKVLGQYTGMYPVFGAAIPYQGGKYGVGILSREKPLNWYTLPLPGQGERRVLLIAEFEKYVFCATHFSLTEADRLASLPLLNGAVEKYRKPVFLAGDLNAHPDDAVIQKLKEKFQPLTDQRKMTFPADKPTECLDYIWGMKGEGIPSYAGIQSRVVEETIASDHRPLYAEVRLGMKKDRIFRTNPYLQNPTDRGITVSWLTNAPVYSWVEYGTDSLEMTRAHTLVDGQVIANNYIHKIRLNHLEPGKTYYYRVCSKEILSYKAYSKVFGETACSDLFSFTLPEEDRDEFTALVFNDIHKHDQTLDALYACVKDIKYDFVVFNGDCIDDPANEEQAVRYLSHYNDKVGASRIPVFYLRGNHEIRNAYSIQLRELFDYVGGKTYGAFHWGDTRFVLLDCGEDKPDTTWVYYGLNDFSQLRQDQVGFLKQELNSRSFKKASKRVLIHHVPVFGNTDKYQPCKELWGEKLGKAPFQVAINAHTHRFAYHPADKEHSFPVVIGGGYSLKDATVMILQKKGNTMTLTVRNTQGKELLKLTF